MSFTQIHQLVESARRQTLPTVIRKLASGWVILGEKQLLKGYCLLLPDPVVIDLNALTGMARTQYLTDMTMIGDVVLQVTGAYRINYEILGNKEPALHAHVFPRYLSEEEHYRTNNPWTYDWASAEKINPTDYAPLMKSIAHGIDRWLSH